MFSRPIFLGICSLVFLVSIRAQAQKDFREGYVVKSIGDTLHGKIDYRGSMRMSNVCVFKASSGEETTYKPEEIIGFRFKDDKYFVSKKVNENFYFLEFLIQGKINVYYKENTGGSTYFMEKEGEKIMELAYKEEIKYVDGKPMRYINPQYKNLMRYYMRDAPSLTKRINTFNKPDHKSLINLAETYHKTVCNDEKCIVYQKNKSLTRISLEMVAGSISFGKSVELDTKIQNRQFSQMGLLAYFWTTKRNEKVFIRLGMLHLPQAGNFFPIQVGYMAPRTFRVRPQIAMSIVMPTYSAGLAVRLGKKVNIGTQAWLRFLPSENLPILPIPNKYLGFAVLGSLSVDLF